MLIIISNLITNFALPECHMQQNIFMGKHLELEYKFSIYRKAFMAKGLYVTSTAKTHHVHTTTEFNFITSANRYTQWLSIPSVFNVKCQMVCSSRKHFADPTKS